MMNLNTSFMWLVLEGEDLFFKYMCANLFELALKIGRVLFSLWGHSEWMRTSNTHCSFGEHHYYR